MGKERIKNGLMLFAFFFKIGCFTLEAGWSISGADGAGVCR